ncbi:MAG TPA: pyridoxal-dependent decarboxylase [Actinomycetota bacterium]|nr:pyridoxal-dependent decarboxylase [Actinomycetota bacterium]
MPEPLDHPEPELVDTRDPERSRAALERLGERTWREALDWLYGPAATRPTAPAGYPDLRRAFFGEGGRPAPAPRAGSTADEVLDEFRDRLAPYAFAAQHPGSYSYFTPPPLPVAIAGETLARWLNQGIDVWLAGMAAPFVEEEVVAWLRDLVGYGEGSWGVLTSGGVMANVMAVAVARDVHLSRLLGLADPPRGSRLEGARAYASDQTHFSIERGLDLAGFPADTLRVVPSDERFRLRLDPVAAAIAEDRAAGLHPFAIFAVAGSTNTGAVDDVPGLADLAEREDLWLHVDAAYGAAARISPREAHTVPGLERADSLTVDPHKWLFQPYDVGGLLVRRRGDLLRTFHREPEYYAGGSQQDRPLHWYQYSLEGTRPFRALKLWLSWKHLGSHGFAQLVERTVDLARHLATGARDRGFDVIEPQLAVVCLRLAPDHLDDAATDELQRRLQRALEVSGAGWLSTTTLRERTWLRAGVINTLSTDDDADRILTELVEASERVLEDLDG